MSGPAAIFARGAGLRWLASVAIVTAAHAAVAVALVRQPSPIAADEAAGAFAVDIASEAVALRDAPVDAASGPPREAIAASAGHPTPPPREAMQEPPAEPITDTPPLPDLPRLQPAIDGELSAPQKQTAQPDPQPVAVAAVPVEATTAPNVVAPRQSDVAATTETGAPSEQLRKAISGWQSRVLDAIERKKRFPADALARRLQGTTVVRFSLDAHGRVQSAAIEISSGNDALDAEAMALLQRAAPFPTPPAGFATGELSIVVPIRFKLR